MLDDGDGDFRGMKFQELPEYLVKLNFFSLRRWVWLVGRGRASRGFSHSPRRAEGSRFRPIRCCRVHRQGASSPSGDTKSVRSDHRIFTTSQYAENL